MTVCVDIENGIYLCSRDIKKQIRHRVSAVSGTTYISMADGEVIDAKKYLEESCKPKCAKPLIEYGACIKRIDGDDTGSKHCTGQYFDYLSCVDKCVAPKLFSKLK